MKGENIWDIEIDILKSLPTFFDDYKNEHKNSKKDFA